MKQAGCAWRRASFRPAGIGWVAITTVHVVPADNVKTIRNPLDLDAHWYTLRQPHPVECRI
jgi:hypothetical protein